MAAPTWFERVSLHAAMILVRTADCQRNDLIPEPRPAAFAASCFRDGGARAPT
jgi:hypothetical protein